MDKTKSQPAVKKSDLQANLARAAPRAGAPSAAKDEDEDIITASTKIQSFVRGKKARAKVAAMQQQAGQAMPLPAPKATRMMGQQVHKQKSDTSLAVSSARVVQDAFKVAKTGTTNF